MEVGRPHHLWWTAEKTSPRRLSVRVLSWREEPGECLGERLGMGQGCSVTGAGNPLYPCVGDVVGHVPSAANPERLGVRPVHHQHRSRNRAKHSRIIGGGAFVFLQLLEGAEQVRDVAVPLGVLPCL